MVKFYTVSKNKTGSWLWLRSWTPNYKIQTEIFIDYTKAFDCVDHYKLWKILLEMGIADHLICLLRNLYTGQEAS